MTSRTNRLTHVSQLDPQIFVTFHQQFLEYERTLADKKPRSELESHILTTIKLLNSTIARDYSNTFSTIRRMTRHGEITYDLLPGILVPRTLFVAKCAVTGLSRLLKLSYFQKTSIGGKAMYQLVFESVDLIDRPMSSTVGIGKVQTVIYLPPFKGSVKIESLDAYPLKYHRDEAGLRAAALKRGNKWVGLLGVHHMQYDGVAAFKCAGKVLKHNVRSRVMVDRGVFLSYCLQQWKLMQSPFSASFKRLNANYNFPQPVPDAIEQVDHTDPRNQIHDPYGNYIQPPAPLQATGGT